MSRLPNSSELGARLAAAARPNRTLIINAGSMMSTVLVTAVLGVVFWWVAARQFRQEAVGVASAAVSAMSLLGFVATVGFGTLLMGELPRRADLHRSLINTALAVSVSIGAVLGLAFAVVAPFVSSHLRALSASWVSAACFAAGVGLTGLAFVVDQALIGLLRGGLQLLRNVVFAVVKLAALVVIAVLASDAGPQWIYSAWAAGIALSLLVLVRFYSQRGEDPLRPSFALLRQMRGSAATHHALNLALRISDLALPIVVLTFLSATANASFYIAWMIASCLFAVPLSLSTALYAVGSGDAARLSDRFRFTIAASLAFAIIANLVLLPVASPLLHVFGQSYEQQATTSLHILALGAFPEAIKTHYVAVHRVERRLRSSLPIVWGGSLLEVVGAAVGARLGGLTGVAIGWLAVVCVEALVMGKDALRASRPRGIESGPAERDAEPGSLAGLPTASAQRL